MSMQKRKSPKRREAPILEESKFKGLKATLRSTPSILHILQVGGRNMKSMGEEGILPMHWTPGQLKRDPQGWKREMTCFKQIIAEERAGEQA